MKKAVHVFTSSPFQDMVNEREIIVKEVMPQLHGLCEERNMTLINVDLRWGVVNDPASHQRILDIIGPELNRASILIAFLGARFGSIPNGEYDSLTALELYRAIVSPSINLLVFTRHPDFTAELAKEYPEIYLESDPNLILEQKKLIRRLKWLQVDTIDYRSYEQFRQRVSHHLGSLFHNLYFTKRADVFISYSRRDALDQADKIRAVLQGLNFNVWLDREGIEVGDEWPEALTSAIKECDVVLILVSLESVKSYFCNKEILFAIKHKKPLLALHLQSLDLPDKIDFMLSDIQQLYLEDYPDLESAMKSITKALESQSKCNK